MTDSNERSPLLRRKESSERSSLNGSRFAVSPPSAFTSSRKSSASSVSSKPIHASRGGAFRDEQSIHDLQLNLLNNGSVAKDHLASERTFMAYVRTSLALATAGIAFMQLLLMGAGDSKKATAKPMALSMVSLGLLVLAVDHDIDLGTFGADTEAFPSFWACQRL
ncbi:hypothetical protein BKA70DRAFT_1236995 [Coprinopsis sp. MPI-PUGE-AT-0042]|nr:hypothetical protein BKA70DRAFT_1236995 [Coprinopsis sp. MPI-PUGE-AT-0042]